MAPKLLAIELGIKCDSGRQVSQGRFFDAHLCVLYDRAKSFHHDSIF